MRESQLQKLMRHFILSDFSCFDSTPFLSWIFLNKVIIWKGLESHNDMSFSLPTCTVILSKNPDLYSLSSVAILRKISWVL